MTTPLERESSDRNRPGTSQRVIACRRRLRRSRVIRPASTQAEVGGQVDTNDLSGLSHDPRPVDTGEILSQAETAASLASRTPVSEVDRHPSLRAR